MNFQPFVRFLVEDQSTEQFLRAWLPRIYPEEWYFEIHPFKGKGDLITKLPKRLNGYAQLIKKNPKWRIVVIVDCDKDDCTKLKARLEKICDRAKLRSKTKCKDADWNIVTRIAIEELETWYFGDWEAVKTAYPKISKAPKAISKPDEIRNTWEKFESILKHHRYIATGLQKGKTAAEIGLHIDPKRSSSPSFKKLYSAIEEAVK